MKVFALVCSIVLTSMAQAADTLYVSATAELGGNGKSWQTAYQTVHTALAFAKPGDELWIARGVYTWIGPSLSMVNGVRLYGGFTGTELLREERDWFRNRTVFFHGDGGTIMSVRNCDSSTAIDGVVFVNSQFLAIEVFGGAPRIKNCQFENNNAAIAAENCTRIRIEFCVFKNNDGVAGGTITLKDIASSPIVWGPYIAQCVFVNNKTLGHGGAVTVENSPLITQISNCVFTGNSGAEAGAIVTDKAWTYIVNCTFHNNTATAMGTEETRASTAWLHGGEVINSIFWNGNLSENEKHIRKKPNVGTSDTFTLKSTANLVEADFELGFWRSDPAFEDPENTAGADGFYGTDDDGLRLSTFSLARDGGIIDRYVNHHQTDVIGNPRLVGRKIDLGAYEQQRSGRLTPPQVVNEIKTGMYTFFFRHAKTDWDQKDPGPSPECFPGRNLIYEGREQAREIGNVQRMLGVPVGSPESSPVCRCWETMDLMCGSYIKLQWWGSGGSPNIVKFRDSILSTVPTGGNRLISSHDAVANANFNPAGDGMVMSTAELMEGDCLFVKPLGDSYEVVAHWCSDTWQRYRVRFPSEATSVSTTEAQTAPFSVHPNPATDYILVDCAQPTSLRIVDMLGIQHITTPSDVHHLIRISQMPDGVFFIVGGDHTASFVIRR